MSTLCTPEVTAIVAKHIAEGIPKCHAYQLAGVSHRSGVAWVQRGESGEEPYASFAAAVAQARAENVRRRVARLKAAGRAANQGAGDWKAEAWLLERLEPAEFAQRTKTELTGADGGPVLLAATGDLSRLTDDELRLAMELRAKMDA